MTLEEKILRICWLCLRITKTTQHAAFFEHSAHVKGFEVSVTESSTKYDVRIYRATFFTDVPDGAPDSMIKALEEILIGTYDLAAITEPI